MNRLILQKAQYNPIIDDTSKGFLDNKEISNIRNNCVDGYILKGMEYRPDLVANYYLGDPRKAWAITFVNNFVNGIKDYTVGKKIKIPKI